MNMQMELAGDSLLGGRSIDTVTTFIVCSVEPGGGVAHDGNEIGTRPILLLA